MNEKGREDERAQDRVVLYSSVCVEDLTRSLYGQSQNIDGLTVGRNGRDP